MNNQKSEEYFYMRICDKCNNFFFSTAKNARICWECLQPNYKKYFSGRGIKYISYNEMIKIRKEKNKHASS